MLGCSFLGYESAVFYYCLISTLNFSLSVSAPDLVVMRQQRAQASTSAEFRNDPSSETQEGSVNGAGDSISSGVLGAAPGALFFLFSH